MFSVKVDDSVHNVGSNPTIVAKYCGVEQWSARLSHKQEVVSNGSNPTRRNKKENRQQILRTSD